MVNFPKITVLMPVYNCELYIREAVDSILNQTFTDFEFLIIDDCSTDKTVEILKEYQDNRINLIIKPKNTGYTNSLNYGLTVAKGTYIARMDGDDISMPERFAKQVDFLDKNPEYVLCSGGLKIIDKDFVLPNFVAHDQIKLELLRQNCIAHPAVMLKKNILQKFDFQYNTDKEPAEDYDLWVRLLKVAKLHNLPEILIHYRVHDTQVSKIKNEKQMISANHSRLMLWNNLKINQEINNFLIKVISNKPLNFDEINEFIKIKSKLLSLNKEATFEPKGFELYLNNLEFKYISKYFFNNVQYSPKLLFQYIKIKQISSFKTTIKKEIKFFVKSIILWRKKTF